MTSFCHKNNCNLVCYFFRLLIDSIEAFEEACKKKEYPLTLRMQEGYDHSYWFIQTFIADHIEHHAKILNH